MRHVRNALIITAYLVAALAHEAVRMARGRRQ